VLQGAAVNYLQTLAAQEVSRIADNLGGDSARTALHGIVACAGAAAQGASCQAAALGASAGTVINALMGDSNTLTATERETRRNIVTTLVAAVGGQGGNLAAAVTAAAIETENNALSLRGSVQLNNTLRSCWGSATGCNLMTLRADMEQSTALQSQRIASACTGASSDVGQCMTLAANANVVAGNLLTAALVYADTPEKQQLVGGLIDRQIADMEGLYKALEGKQQAAGVLEVLGAAIAGTMQAVAMGGITLPSKKTVAGTGPVVSSATFADTAKLQDHFSRHGSDFGATTATQYQGQASQFLTSARPNEVLEKVRSNGDVVRYNPTTEEFGVISANGSIRTYYRPDPAVHGYSTNAEYFNVQ
jgi:hypothetical protein